MTWVEDIADAMRREGGIVVTPEFLGADGAAVDWLGPVLIGEAAFSDRTFAFIAVRGGRPHCEFVSRVSREDRVWSRMEPNKPVSGSQERPIVKVPGEYRRQKRHVVARPEAKKSRVWCAGRRWVLHAPHRGTRLTVEPLATDEQRRAVAEWRRFRHGRESVLALEGALSDLHAGWLEEPREPATRIEFRAAWNARLNGLRELATVGALVEGPGHALTYVSVDDALQHSVQVELWDALARGPAEEVFDYMVHSGNGVTNDWSLQFTIAAPSIEVATARLMTRLRFRGDLISHLRELWLASWPDTAQDVAGEAEEIIQGRALDARAAEYLAQIRAAAAQAPSGSGPACRRSTRGGGPRGRPSGGGGRAP